MKDTLVALKIKVTTLVSLNLNDSAPLKIKTFNEKVANAILGIYI